MSSVYYKILSLKLINHYNKTFERKIRTMGFEPYTVEELVSYYQQKIGALEGFDISHIHLVDNLQTIADQYSISEPCDNMNGFTIPMNGCVIAILNNLPGYNSIATLFHELTHVKDFVWFSQKYNTNNIHQHYLYYALQIYSEINAHFLGDKLTIDFLSKGNFLGQQYIYSSMNLSEILQNNLCCMEIKMHDIANCLGYILLYDNFYHIEDHMSHIPDSVSPRTRGAIQALLDSYFDKNIEAIDHIIHLLID